MSPSRAVDVGTRQGLTWMSSMSSLDLMYIGTVPIPVAIAIALNRIGIVSVPSLVCTLDTISNKSLFNLKASTFTAFRFYMPVAA
jgi:hypothetical protein